MPDTIPFGEWTPDHAAFHHTDMHRAADASGVYPATDHSYGPFPSFSTLSSNALTARCQGATSGRDKSGNVMAFAGDTTRLYKRSGQAWSDVSKGATTYTAIGDEEQWNFVQIGDRMVALSLTNYPQLFTMSRHAARRPSALDISFRFLRQPDRSAVR